MAEACGTVFRANGGRFEGRRYACPRLTLFATSRSRALRKFPDGNFRRPLVGSLRACSFAEMVAPRCIAAARIGFLLAALHSVAKRVSRGQAYHPTRCCPRLPEDRTARLRRHDQQLRSPFTSHRGMSPRWRRSRDSVFWFWLSPGISRASHSSGTWGPSALASTRGQCGVWVGARSEG